MSENYSKQEHTVNVSDNKEVILTTTKDDDGNFVHTVDFGKLDPNTFASVLRYQLIRGGIVDPAVGKPEGGKVTVSNVNKDIAERDISSDPHDRLAGIMNVIQASHGKERAFENHSEYVIAPEIDNFVVKATKLKLGYIAVTISDTSGRVGTKSDDVAASLSNVFKELFRDYKFEVDISKSDTRKGNIMLRPHVVHSDLKGAAATDLYKKVEIFLKAMMPKSFEKGQNADKGRSR